jgi:COMPASS component SWD3
VERPARLNYVPYMTLRGHKRGVAAVKFSPDGKWIASCCTTHDN